MKQYYLYQIDKYGTPKLKMASTALCIETMWAGSRGWFSNGIYLITSGDGSEAKIFTIKRG